MTSVTWNSSTLSEAYAPVPSAKPGSPAGPASANGVQSSDEGADSLQFSPAALREAALTGRVAANADNGNLTSDQAQQLYGRVSSIHSQIVADRQSDGGALSSTDAQAIQQSQSQLSQTIYSDAHNGATPPSAPDVTRAGAREALEAGRIALDEKAGNLSGDQAKQLSSQLAAIQQQTAADEQADGGTLSPADAKAINQQENQFSHQIYEAAHSGATPAQ